MIPKIEKMAIYYGYPSHVNGCDGHLEKSIDEFKVYDSIVFGANLELEKHEDHIKTTEIIQSLGSNKHVFGYVNLGTNNGKLSIKEIHERIKKWKKMSAYGIFLDAAGYDYGVTRDRQNQTIQFIHDQNLRVFINAFNPDDVFSSDSVPISSQGGGNPKGEKCLLTKEDVYLHESFQIQDGQYVDPDFWATKTKKAMDQSRPFGTKHMATTTTSRPIDFSQDQMNYAWWSARLWGFHGFSWGEKWFSSDGSLPLHDHPSANIGKTFTSEVQGQGHLFTRPTDLGTITLDADNHIGLFTSG